MFKYSAKFFSFKYNYKIDISRKILLKIFLILFIPYLKY